MTTTAEKFAAVLFDCDGVLVDSEMISKNVLVEEAARLGATIDPKWAHDRFKGRRMADCLVDVEAIMQRPLPHDFMARFRKAEYVALGKQVTAIPRVAPLLDALKVPSCVASNGPREKIECTLGATGLDRYFADRIFSAYELDRFKPDPELYLHAARVLGVSPQRCIVMEDSITGATAGVDAGMRVIAYTPGVDRSGYPYGDLHHVDDMADAMELIARWT